MNYNNNINRKLEFEEIKPKAFLLSIQKGIGFGININWDEGIYIDIIILCFNLYITKVK